MNGCSLSPMWSEGGWGVQVVGATAGRRLALARTRSAPCWGLDQYAIEEAHGLQRIS